MFAVIFEVQPKPERWDDYLALAGHLKPLLERSEGFIDNERFTSRRTEGRVLSLSTWRDEKAVIRWRTQGEHHGVQQQGRSAIFADYHLRVGEVASDTQPPPGMKVAQQRFDETEIGRAKMLTISEVSPDGSSAEGLAAALGLDPGPAGLLDHEVYESISNPGKLLLLAAWHDAEAAGAFAPQPIGGLRHRAIRVIRDYGMFERIEAPQYYPPAARKG